MSTRWGTKELGPPDPPRRPLGSKETPRQQRDPVEEERVERGITGAVLRHRMLPFLISVRFWRKQQKGAKLKRGLGNGQLGHLLGVSKSSHSEQGE